MSPKQAALCLFGSAQATERSVTVQPETRAHGGDCQDTAAALASYFWKDLRSEISRSAPVVVRPSGADCTHRMLPVS